MKKMPGQAYSPSDFKITKEVGEGSFGRVFLCNRKSDNKEFAIKMLDKAHILKVRHLAHLYQHHKVDGIMREKKILSEINHPNIINLIGTFQDEENLFFVLEFAENGDLCEMIKSHGKFSSELIQFYAAQIVNALEHLHKNGIVHRDLKPQNIMIDKTGFLKLIDFGDSLIEGHKDDIEEEEKIQEKEEEELEDSEEEEPIVEFSPHGDLDDGEPSYYS